MMKYTDDVNAFPNKYTISPCISHYGEWRDKQQVETPDRRAKQLRASHNHSNQSAPNKHIWEHPPGTVPPVEARAREPANQKGGDVECRAQSTKPAPTTCTRNARHTPESKKPSPLSVVQVKWAMQAIVIRQVNVAPRSGESVREDPLPPRSVPLATRTLLTRSWFAGGFVGLSMTSITSARKSFARSAICSSNRPKSSSSPSGHCAIMDHREPDARRSMLASLLSA